MLCQRFSSFYSVKGLWRERDKYFRWKTESLSKITSSGLRGLSDRTWDISVRIIVNYFGIWISTRDLWDDSIKNISPGPVLKLTEYFSIWTNVTDVHSDTNSSISLSILNLCNEALTLCICLIRVSHISWMSLLCCIINVSIPIWEY